MSKHNLSEKSNFTNLSEFLVRKKIIYFVALKYDHTVLIIVSTFYFYDFDLAPPSSSGSIKIGKG